MRRLLDVPLHWPRVTLVVMLVLTAVFGAFAARIRVDSSIENLLPSDDPARLYYDQVKTVFGDEEIAVIGVFAENVFTPSTLARIDALSKRLAQIDGVREVISPTTVEGVELNDGELTVGRVMREVPQSPEAAADFRRRLLANPLYVKNVVAADGRAAGISVGFEPMSDEEYLRRGIDAAIRALVAEMGGPEEWAVTGIPTIKENGARLMERDVMVFTPLAMLLVIAVLVLAFRTWRGVVVPLSTIVVGVIWTDGLMVMRGDAIDMGTLVLNPLLMVVGIASGIHLISQYYLEVQPGRTNRQVVEAAVAHVRAPIVVAAATTLIGFGTLVFTPIRAVQQFGKYSVFGIAVIVLTAFTVVPAMLSLLRLPTRIPTFKADGSGWLPPVLRGIAAFAVRHRRGVLVWGAAAIALCIWGIGRVRVETDYLEFFDPAGPIRTANARVGEGLAGTQPIYIVVDGEGAASVTRIDTLRAMRDLQEFVDRQAGVDKTMSLLDYLALLRGVLQAEAPPGIPETQSEVDQLMLLVDPATVAAVVNRDASRANIIVRTQLSGSTEVGAFVDAVQRFADQRFPGSVRVRPTGTVVLLSQSADALAWGQVTGLWQELAVLLALLSFMFLSLRVGLLALIPNVFPTVVLFGIMGWSGISLNISTSMIAAIAIGIAIDDTIHLLSAFNGELRRTGDQAQAVLNAMGSVGQAAFFIALALSAGFFVVCLSNFQPVRHFGLLSGVTMGIALLVEFFLTPALVTTTRIITLWDLLFLKLGREPQKEIPLFAGLRPFQAKVVVLMGRLESAARGESIARRGELRAELYVLLSGQAEVCREGADRRVLRTLARGDVVGEMGLVRERPRSADVVVVADAEYLVLDKRFLYRLRRQYPRIASTVFLNLTRILSDRLETTTDALAASAGPTAPDHPAAR
ncbi:MMPL family transporter [Candidatus Binatia bacterium]|nr:MMPL family transporter [Candidatus Binatia bacterium]